MSAIAEVFAIWGVRYERYLLYGASAIERYLLYGVSAIERYLLYGVSAIEREVGICYMGCPL